MTTIVKAADAAQFLALIPRMLGYRPARSVVLVPFCGARSVGVMRVDLPDCADDEIDRIAATFIGMVCRIPDADALAVVVYTDAGFADGMPHLPLARAIERRADACGLRYTDALCVAGDAWGSYLDSDLPAGGRPLHELEEEPAGAEHLTIADGDQASGAGLPELDAAERERVAGALAALESAVELVCGPDAAAGRGGARGADRPSSRRPGPAGDRSARRRAVSGDRGDESADPFGGVPADAGGTDEARERRVDPSALVAVCRLDDLPALFEDALRWDTTDLPPFDAATMIWALSRPALRDIALVEWCGGLAAGDEAFDAQLRWEAGEEYPAHLAMHMWGEGDRPRVERLEAALALTRRVAAAAPEPSGAGPLATCAWLAWALGRSTHAERYAIQACELEPEHGLAEIVRSFVHAGHLPDWAFRPH